MSQQRINKLRKILEEKSLDAFLVSNFYNILYLSGFKTLTENEREGWVLVTTKNTYLFSDNRYIGSLSSRGVKRRSDLNKEEIASLPSVARNDIITKLITPEKGLIKHLQEIVFEEKISRLGIEGDDLKISEFNRLKQKLVNVESIPTEKLIIKQREIKDEEEISSIRTACQITDKCLEDIVKTIKIGTSEKEIAFKIEFWLKEKNYDLAFYPIVAVDKNSSLPHYDTRSGDNKKIKKGSIILIDFGAKYQDYLSDITRMIFIGNPPQEMINIYNHLLNAQQKTINYLVIMRSHDNYCGKEIDQYCRKQLTTSHQPLIADIYPHSTGHGVGLEIHEYPKISPVSTDEIKAGQVFTIEPGAYMTGKWGMRIEDTVLIKENGVEVLINFKKQLLTLDF